MGAATTRLRLAGGTATIIAVTAALAWSLAYPHNELIATAVRVPADIAVVMVLGLTVVPMLETQRYRREFSMRVREPLVLAAGVWLAAEITRLVVTAAETAAVPVTRLGVRTTTEFALSTTAGRAGLVCVVAALVVLAATVVSTPENPSARVAVAGAAAIGTAARTMVGHLAENPVGGAAIAAHALAAAVWCGALAALVLTIEHRGQWARMLPRFSRMSLWCVAVLLAGGTLGALAMLASPAALVTTGYGRVLTAKIAGTVFLVLLARRNRAHWVPAASAHQITAAGSSQRSQVELALMAVTLTLAAALAVTG